MARHKSFRSSCAQCFRARRVSSPAAAQKPHCQRWRPHALESVYLERKSDDDSSETSFEENTTTSRGSTPASSAAADMNISESCERAAPCQFASAGGTSRPGTPAAVQPAKAGGGSHPPTPAGDNEREAGLKPGLLYRAGKKWFGTPRCQNNSGTPTSTDEIERIRQLMELLQPEQPLGDLSDFAKAYGDEAFCRRLLRKYHNNMQKSSERFKQALHWREQHKALITSRQFVHSSDYRVIGADVSKRPLLYMCYKNLLLPSSQCYDQLVVCMLQAIDNMPPGVETATHIWDLNGMKFRLSDLNPAPLIQMASTVEAYFAERMHDLVIIEMPRFASFLKDALWPLISEKTKSKVKFLSREQAGEYLHAVCDEEVSHRILAVMAQNRDSRLSLEDRRSSWMRVDKQGDLIPAFT